MEDGRANMVVKEAGGDLLLAWATAHGKMSQGLPSVSGESRVVVVEAEFLQLAAKEFLRQHGRREGKVVWEAPEVVRGLKARPATPVRAQAPVGADRSVVVAHHYQLQKVLAREVAGVGQEVSVTANF